VFLNDLIETLFSKLETQLKIFKKQRLN